MNDGRRRGALVNWLMPVLIGLAVTALLWYYRFPTLNPVVWGDVAAANGVRPPTHILQGLIRAGYLWCFTRLPYDQAVRVLMIAGWVVGGLIAALSYRLFLSLSGSLILKLCELRSSRGRIIVASAMTVAAVGFALCDPVWYAVQGGLSAVGFDLLLIEFAMLLAWRFTVTSRRRYAFLSMFLFAVLSAEMPLGFVGAVLLTLLVFWVEEIGDDDNPASRRLLNPLVRLSFHRTLGVIFAVTFILSLWVELTQLQDLAGYAGVACDTPLLDRLVAYAREIYRFFLDAAPWKAWVLLFILVASPFVVARLIRDRALDEERFLPASFIVMLTLLGVVAWSQISGFKDLWYGNWFDKCAVNEPLLGMAAVFLSAITTAWTLTAVGVSLFIRKPTAVAEVNFDDDAMEMPDGRRALERIELFRHCIRPVAAFVPVLIVLNIVQMRDSSVLRGMLRSIDDYVVETVRECRESGVTRLFTDGSLDVGMELEAHRHGETLLATSLLARGDAQSRRLLNRGLTNEYDMVLLDRGVPHLLRTWVQDGNGSLATTGVQLGFELWRRRESEARPVYLGTIALPPERPADAPCPDRDAAAARARELGGRLLALYDEGKPDREGTPLIRTLLRYVQWRLSRFGFMRAESIGRLDWGEAASLEQELANRLRDRNSSYREMKEAMSRMVEERSARLSPREGLRLGLDRANFRMAATFAESIIVATPDDLNANFAIAMNHFTSEEFVQAEPYFRKCLEKRPDDPAILNNLAVVEFRLYRYEEAEHFAKAALEAIQRLPPEQAEYVTRFEPQVKRTIQAIREARERISK